MFKKKVLDEKVTKQIGKYVKEFSSVIEENNDDYAFYRGEVYSENDMICIRFRVSDENGIEGTAEMVFNPESDTLSYSKKFSMKNEQEVIKALVKFISKIERFNPPISVLRFDIGMSYQYCQIEPSVDDPGCAIMLIVATKSKDVSGREISLVKGWS